MASTTSTTETSSSSTGSASFCSSCCSEGDKVVPPLIGVRNEHRMVGVVVDELRHIMPLGIAKHCHHEVNGCCVVLLFFVVSHEHQQATTAT